MSTANNRSPNDQPLRQRVEREQKAHTERDVLAESSELKARFPHILQFPSRKHLYSVMEDFVQGIRGKTILDYGCGRGETSLRYLSRGAITHAIDISPVYIADANRAAQEAGYSAEQYSFSVMDAHDLTFEDNTFDIVIGYGILHHLDAEIALDEIYRVLKPGGRVLLQEPLADNPLLKLFRSLTPHARTEDERPFSKRDLKYLPLRRRWKTEFVYCGLIEAPVAMITSMLIPDHPENIPMRLADNIERWTHEQGILLSWNQYVLFNMVK